MSRSAAAPRFAEAMLRLYVGRSRAAALIGDLLEVSTNYRHPALYFCTRAGSLLAPFAGRSTLAYLAAAYVFSVSISDWLDQTFGTPPTAMVFGVSAAVSMLGSMCIVLAAFSFFRFGPIARITLLSFGLGGSMLAATWRFPADPRVVAFSVAVFCVAFLAALRSHIGRRTLTVIGVSAAGTVAVTVACRFIQSVLHLRFLGSRSYTAHFTQTVNGVITSKRDIFIPGHETGVGLALLTKIASLVSLLVLTTLASSFYSRWVLNDSPGNIPT